MKSPAGLRTTALRRLRHDPISMIAFGILVLLVLAAIIGGPLAAKLTGHGPNEQFANALASNSLPLGIGQRTYLANGTTHNPRGACSSSAPTRSAVTSSSGFSTARGSRCSLPRRPLRSRW